ncbi:hypothetical protein SLEP1_g30439 [Rubroshorea leprosula]|uniref:EamA domain-containing protein n=1 Tax=Rubroshorea leprosula TaxID=152421 RepID=A0AAV5K015_9ROSI|nr:hypothetical protein SLEP1_g30439 [Rubroshorea leprosula]
MMKISCDEWKPFITMIAIDFAFAVVNILLKEVLDEGMNHLVLVTYRLSISTIFLAPVAYFCERNSRPKLTFHVLCYLFCGAIVGTSLTQFLFLLGIQYTSATFACAFLNMVPVTTFVMALPFRIERASLRCSSGRAKIGGSLICVGGALLLIFHRGMPLFKHSGTDETRPGMELNLGRRTTERWTLGSMALTAGVLLWSSWFFIQLNVGRRYPCQYSSTAIMTFFGTIQSALLSLFSGRNLSMWVLKGKMEIITILYAGMVGSGLCFVGMAWCVKEKGPVFTAAFSPFVQILSAMFDILILHEQLHLGSLLGSIIVIIGLYILLWGKNKELQNRFGKMGHPITGEAGRGRRKSIFRGHPRFVGVRQRPSGRLGQRSRIPYRRSGSGSERLTRLRMLPVSPITGPLRGANACTNFDQPASSSKFQIVCCR